MNNPHHHNPLQPLSDALYCHEEHWDDNDDADNSLTTINHKPFVEMFESKWEEEEDEELSSLLHKEQENQPYSDLEENPSLAKARGDAVEWMLKVTAHYSFSAVTSVLAVDYLDKFLHSFQSHRDKPWMSQLAAVACISLAAKMEETQVPLLIDLQVEESKYVFESKTIQRMEVLILSTLKWKMNPVTPLSFLDFIVRKLGLKSHLRREFNRRCESLLLSVLSDCRFMCHLPSAMATATMLYVISSLEPSIAVEYQDQLLSILGINQDKARECCGLLQEVATSVHFHSCNRRSRIFRSFPSSPKGVVDVCFSSDSSNDSWGLSSSASVSSSPEPLSKKIKTHNSPKNAIF